MRMFALYKEDGPVSLVGPGFSEWPQEVHGWGPSVHGGGMGQFEEDAGVL